MAPFIWIGRMRSSPMLACPPDRLCVEPGDHDMPRMSIVGLVELRGIEPLTSAVRLQRSPI